MRLMICTVLAVILCSCGQKIPDPEGCIELTRGNARCSTLFSAQKRDVSKEVWKIERVGRISYSPKGVGELILFIERVCNRTQNCVSDWETKLNKSLKNMGYRRR